jgi:hypothetical protein
MVDTLVAVASFYFTCDINLKARGWQRLVGSECVVLMWWCMCGGVYRMVYMRLAMHVTRGPPPYRGLYRCGPEENATKH